MRVHRADSWVGVWERVVTEKKVAMRLRGCWFQSGLELRAHPVDSTSVGKHVKKQTPLAVAQDAGRAEVVDRLIAAECQTGATQQPPLHNSQEPSLEQVPAVSPVSKTRGILEPQHSSTWMCLWVSLCSGLCGGSVVHSAVQQDDEDQPPVGRALCVAMYLKANQVLPRVGRGDNM
eukprot:453666-Rhodomonas_salina.1